MIKVMQASRDTDASSCIRSQMISDETFGNWESDILKRSTMFKRDHLFTLSALETDLMH